MAKKIDGYINLQVPAGQANPSPPIGPALGQRGLNIMEFCKQFNAKTKDMEAGRADPGEDHGVLGPLLQLRDAHAAGVAISSRRSPRSAAAPRSRAATSAGTVTMAQVREVAKQKMKDLNTDSLDAAANTIAGIGAVDGHAGGGVRA